MTKTTVIASVCVFINSFSVFVFRFVFSHWTDLNICIWLSSKVNVVIYTC